MKNQISRHVRIPRFDSASNEQRTCIEIYNASISKVEINFMAVAGGARITVWRIDFSEDYDTEVEQESLGWLFSNSFSN